MGKRGPAPKPTQLRLLHGDRKDRINADEPQPSEGLPECPPGASDEVRDVWDYILSELAVMRIVTPADRDALYAYCEAVAQHRQASREIADVGLTVRAMNGGYTRNPAVQIQRDAAALVRAFAQEFGLTPSARSQIKMGGGEKSDAGAARLLSG